MMLGIHVDDRGCVDWSQINKTRGTCSCPGDHVSLGLGWDGIVVITLGDDGIHLSHAVLWAPMPRGNGPSTTTSG